nr:hypothetical protein [Neobacillus sp. Marseille-Q6967]
MKDKSKDNSTIVSNDALRGKPYLDIDRVITEPRSENLTKEK